MVPDGWVRESVKSHAVVSSDAKQPVEYGYKWWITPAREGSRG